MLDRAREMLPRDSATLLTQLFGARVGLGVVLALAPRWSWRQLCRSNPPTDEAALAVRMLGGREIALGLGGLLASRHDGAVRGWAEAGALADTVDAAALAVSPGVSGWRRPATVLLAGGAAAAGLGAARSLEASTTSG